MSKREWKEKYSAYRALYSAAHKMPKIEGSPAREQALDIVAELMRKEGFWSAFFGSIPHRIYPISTHRWAIRQNARCY